MELTPANYIEAFTALITLHFSILYLPGIWRNRFRITKINAKNSEGKSTVILGQGQTNEYAQALALRNNLANELRAETAEELVLQTRVNALETEKLRIARDRRAAEAALRETKRKVSRLNRRLDNADYRLAQIEIAANMTRGELTGRMQKTA